MIEAKSYKKTFGLIAIDELLQSNFQRCSLPIVPIDQVAPNLHTNIYKLSAPEGDLFLKHYHDRMDIATAEYDNYQFFKGLPFVPKLLYRTLDMNKKSVIFAYEYIEGNDIHEEFTRKKKSGEPIIVNLGIQTVDQFYEMDATLRKSSFKSSKTPWVLQSPVREGLLDSSEEIEFLGDYQVVMDKNEKTLKFFPGFYFDRNPRNVMYTHGWVMEVDYNVIEFTSPLFDLAKFLRNGTDIPFLTSIDSSAKYLARLLNVYNGQEEKQILQHAYSRQLQVSPLGAGSFEDFYLMFNYAAIHTHIFYLTKYAKMLKEGKGVSSNLLSRCTYHFSMLNKTIEELQVFDDSINQIRVWAKKFISLGQSS